MSDYTVAEVKEAAKSVSWEYIASIGEDAVGALYLRSQPVMFEVVSLKTGSYFDGYETNSQENYIIFALGTQFFRQGGWSDSYGDSSWDEGLTEVKPTTKTTMTFEPKD